MSTSLRKLKSSNGERLRNRLPRIAQAYRQYLKREFLRQANGYASEVRDVIMEMQPMMKAAWKKGLKLQDPWAPKEERIGVPMPPGMLKFLGGK